jgi:hypothetical protein
MAMFFADVADVTVRSAPMVGLRGNEGASLMGQLDGKVALVTGSGQGLGRCPGLIVYPLWKIGRPQE